MITARRSTSELYRRMEVARGARFVRVRARAGETVHLDDVAQAAGASVYHFARLYRSITGETVGAAVTRLRIERGAQRLCDAPGRSISEIALEVGYRMPSSFNKA